MLKSKGVDPDYCATSDEDDIKDEKEEMINLSKHL